VLLREIPTEPLNRRFFFTAMVACRRRLAKRWEQTPLAKLFTLEDQWSLLKQRAQAVRMRQAIRLRGMLLHDAFQKFDWDRNGTMPCVSLSVCPLLAHPLPCPPLFSL
jgi:hypothetical protein